MKTKSVWQTWRFLPWPAFFAYALGRLLAHVPGVDIFIYRLIAMPLSALPVQDARATSFHVRPLDADEVRRRAPDMALSAVTVAHRLDQGMTCLAVLARDDLAGCIWLGAGPFNEDEVAVRFVPPAGAAWDTGLYIAPAYRLTRAFTALWGGVASWLRARNLHWSMSRITLANEAAWAAHRRIGAIELRRLVILKWGAKQWVWGVKGDPVIMVELPSSAVPR